MGRRSLWKQHVLPNPLSLRCSQGGQQVAPGQEPSEGPSDQGAEVSDLQVGTWPPWEHPPGSDGSGDPLSLSAQARCFLSLPLSSCPGPPSLPCQFFVLSRDVPQAGGSGGI